MRHLTIIDIALHKIGINTRCFTWWNTTPAYKVAAQMQEQSDFNKYRRQCIVNIDGKYYDFTGEFDFYIKKGFTPWYAWNEVMEEYARK